MCINVFCLATLKKQYAMRLMKQSMSNIALRYQN